MFIHARHLPYIQRANEMVSRVRASFCVHVMTSRQRSYTMILWVKVCLLLMATLWMEGHWMLENPLSSCVRILRPSAICFRIDFSVLTRHCVTHVGTCSPEIHWHVRLQQLLANRQRWAVSTWLGAFGGSSPKPVRLWASHPFVQRLKRRL